MLESECFKEGGEVGAAGGGAVDFVARGLSIKRLGVWVLEPLQRLRFLSVLTDACHGKWTILMKYVFDFNCYL